MTNSASENLRRHADRMPQRTACIDDGVAYSFRQLDALVDRLTLRLRELGVNSGDRVCVLLDNAIQFVMTYVAVLRAGAVIVPIDVRTPSAGVEELVADASARLVVCDTRRSSDLEPLSSANGVSGVEESGVFAPLRFIVCGRREGSPADEVPVEPSGVPQLASIIYTSGTTGRPKGVMLTLANIAAVARAGAESVRLDSDDRVGLVTPLSHLYGLREIDTCLWTGATLVVARDLAYPARVLDQLHASAVTGLSAVPSGMTLVMERYQGLLSRCREHLRYLALGTALAPLSLLQAVRGCLPETRLFVTYGLTEASRVCYRQVEKAEEDHGAVGRPYPGVTLSVLDEHEAPVGAGQSGRIALASTMVMQGYWCRPDLTAKVLRPEGTLLTPDYGWLDVFGTLHLRGRIDEIINCGGEKVGPEEVEMVLLRHPGIADAAVAGVPDPARVMGEVVKAYLVRRPGAIVDVDAVLQHCARFLEPYKVPKTIEFCESLPKTALGKTVRSRLERSSS